MAWEKVVALFDTPAHAEAARENLLAAGVGDADISIVNSGVIEGSGPALRAPGFWNRLLGRDVLESDANVYADAIDRGGCVLTVRCAADDVARIMGILNVHDVVDVQRRAVERNIITERAVEAVPVVPVPVAPVVAPLAQPEVLKLAEEQLQVGKRMVEGGATRIRRYVVEKPVEAEVTLHEEHAAVIRRAIDEPAYVKDIDWADRAIEVREMAEEPVVSKTARYVEEVGLEKVGSERVEKITDTVRKEEVAVDKVAAVDVDRVVVEKDRIV